MRNLVSFQTFIAKYHSYKSKVRLKVANIKVLLNKFMYGHIDRYLIIRKHDTGVPQMEVTRQTAGCLKSEVVKIQPSSLVI